MEGGSWLTCIHSLGVLKKEVVNFEPKLPNYKRDIIKKFDMATYTKIFLQFPADKIFWNTTTEFFLYADPKTRGYYPLFQSLEAPGFEPVSLFILFLLSLRTSKSISYSSQQQSRS